jgi:micrococcal nuclease
LFRTEPGDETMASEIEKLVRAVYWGSDIFDRPERPKKSDIKLLVTAVSFGIVFHGDTIEALRVAVREERKGAAARRPNEIQMHLAEEELGELSEDLEALEDDDITRKSLAEDIFEHFWEAAVDEWEDDPETRGYVDIEPEILKRCFGMDPRTKGPIPSVDSEMNWRKVQTLQRGKKGCMTLIGSVIVVLGLLFADCDSLPYDTVRHKSESSEHVSTIDTAQDAATHADPETKQETDSDVAGKVVAVLDGDTIDILNGDKTTPRIRFNGIDCPEKGQPFGNNAKEFLSQTIAGKVVRIVEQDTDRYGRTIADVYLPADVAYAGSNPAGAILPDMFLNRELVQRGLAWHYKTYSDDERLAEDEDRARADKLGLLSDPRHVAPWEWRGS